MSNLLVDLVTTAAADALVGTSRPVVPTYLPDYGSDLACGDDAEASFRERPGDDPMLIVEAAWRFITSPRDSIPDAPGRGIDIRDFLRQPATQARILTWPAIVRGEIEQDDRIESSEASFVQQSDGKFKVYISITPTGSQGPFALVGELTPTGAILKEILAP
jgi:hypothetical protein